MFKVPSVLKLFALLTGFHAMVLTHCACADNIIHWQTYHRPPAVITVGEDTGKGFLQLVLYRLIQQLPDYQHEMPLTSLNRALDNMKAGKHACHPFLYPSPERREYVHFSVPIMFNPSNKLISRKPVLERLPNPANLYALTNNPDNRFALVENRSYGQVIDQAIAGDDKANLQFRLAPEEMATIFHMLAVGRIDYTIAYPYELNYFQRLLGDKSSTLAPRNIEATPNYQNVHVGCAKTPWGKKVIEDINLALNVIRSDSQYLEDMTTWWPEHLDTQGFRDFYHNEFLTK